MLLDLRWNDPDRNCLKKSKLNQQNTFHATRVSETRWVTTEFWLMKTISYGNRAVPLALAQCLNGCHFQKSTLRFIVRHRSPWHEGIALFLHFRPDDSGFL